MAERGLPPARAASEALGRGARRPPTLAPRRAATSGATALEFGLVAPALVVLVCAMLEMGLQGATAAALDIGTREASRFGVTGNAAPDGLGGPPPASREEAVRRLVTERGGALLKDGALSVRLVAHPGDASTLGKPGGGAQGSAGGPGDIVEYVVTLDRPVFTPLARLLWGRDSVTHRSRALVRNEPFPVPPPDAA